MMKTKLKHLILLLFAFAIWSCNDDYEEHNHEHNFKNYKIKKYTYKQALKLQKFGAADKIAKQSLNLKFGKINLSKKGRKSQISKDASSILAIDSSLIKEVSTGDITSYTMLVVLDSVDYSDGSFDNLVIQTNKNNETDAFVIHYQPSSDVEYNAEHESYNFEGTTTTSKVYGIYSFFNNGNNNTPGSNEGFYGGEPGGSTGSIICVDVLKCNGTRHGGVGPIHNAGPGCTQTFTVRECSSNPNWNPYSTGSGGSNESGGFGNGNNNTGPGGGGMGTGGNTTGSNTTNLNNPITSTVFTEELEEEIYDNCETFTKLQNKEVFKNFVSVLKDSTDLDHEVGYALTDNATGYDAIQGTPDADLDYAVAYDIPNGTVVDILIHTHYTGGLSIFSPDDLQQVYKMLKNPNITIPKNFTCVVVTPSNEVYALTIDNKTNFLAFGDKNLSTEEKFYTFLNLFYLNNSDDGVSAFNGYNINVGNSKEVNEMNFLKMLGDKSGIKLFKANSDLSQWQNLKIEANAVTESNPCN